jgi:hypothetical protein
MGWHGVPLGFGLVVSAHSNAFLFFGISFVISFVISMLVIA